MRDGKRDEDDGFRSPFFVIPSNGKTAISENVLILQMRTPRQIVEREQEHMVVKIGVKIRPRATVREDNHSCDIKQT